MDLAITLRQARQYAGLSQRALAERAGCGSSTVAGIEAGTRSCSALVLEQLLSVCGLDLDLAAPVLPEVPGLSDHLRLSTTNRLYEALGGTWPIGEPYPEGWVELCQRAHRARTVLAPATALPIWLPGLRVPDPVVLSEDEAPGLVEIGVGGGKVVLAQSPLSLALEPTLSAHSSALRLVSRLLLGSASRDEGDRRAPPHRSPHESTETHHLSRALTYAMLPVRELPQVTDGRGWRLDQPVSLRQWLQARGMPPRRGSSRWYG